MLRAEEGIFEPIMYIYLLSQYKNRVDITVYVCLGVLDLRDYKS